MHRTQHYPDGKCEREYAGIKPHTLTFMRTLPLIQNVRKGQVNIDFCVVPAGDLRCITFPVRHKTDISQSQTDISQSQTDISQSQTDISQSHTDISQSQTDISQSQTDISQSQTHCDVARSPTALK